MSRQTDYTTSGEMAAGTALYGRQHLTPVQQSAVEVLRFFDCDSRDAVLDLLAHWNGRVLLSGDDTRVICDALVGWTHCGGHDPAEHEVVAS